MEKPLSLGDVALESGRVIGPLLPILFGLSLFGLVAEFGDHLLSEMPGETGHRSQLTMAFAVINLLLTVTVGNLASQRVLGQPVSFKKALDAGSARFGAMFGTGLLHNILVAFGSVALIVPGLIMATRWALYVPVVLFEGLSGMAALHRSSLLTEGHRWKILALLVPLCLVPLSVRIVGLSVLTSLGSTWLELLISYLAESLGLAAMVVMVVVYYQLCPPPAAAAPEPLGFSPAE